MNGNSSKASGPEENASLIEKFRYLIIYVKDIFFIITIDEESRDERR